MNFIKRYLLKRNIRKQLQNIEKNQIIYTKLCLLISDILSKIQKTLHNPPTQLLQDKLIALKKALDSTFIPILKEKEQLENSLTKL